jgi:hypothetical protein
VVLAKGPVGYWRLGEEAGPVAADETQNGYHGSYFGNPTFGVPGAIESDPDTAVQFQGTDYVEIPDSEAFSQPTSGAGLTVEAWLRPDLLQFPGETNDPYIYWLGKGTAGEREWAFRFYSQNSTRPNRISAYLWSPDGALGAGAYFEDRVVAGQWIHVVACFEPGDADTDAGVHIYKNGVHRLGPPSPGTLYKNYNVVPFHRSSPLRLATRDVGSLLIGALDEVAIYPRVLSAEEIAENYVNGVSASTRSLNVDKALVPFVLGQDRLRFLNSQTFNTATVWESSSTRKIRPKGGTKKILLAEGRDSP